MMTPGKTTTPTSNGYTVKTVLGWFAAGVIAVVSSIVSFSYVAATDAIKANNQSITDHRTGLGHAGMIERVDGMQRQLNRVQHTADATKGVVDDIKTLLIKTQGTD